MRISAAKARSSVLVAPAASVDDHAMIGVDQVVIGVGEKGVSLVSACPLRRRIGSRDELRPHGRGGSERCVVESGKVETFERRFRGFRGRSASGRASLKKDRFRETAVVSTLAGAADTVEL